MQRLVLLISIFLFYLPIASFSKAIEYSSIVHQSIRKLSNLTCSETDSSWQNWEKFKRHYLSKDGRVIDPMNHLDVTTSEGQSYALFFALIANDQNTFDHLLNWTIHNLAKGDLSKNLPAWLWGKHNNQWQVLDPNSASDSNIWIAFVLLEAGRLWENEQYSRLAFALLHQIEQKLITSIDDFGDFILPGEKGFSHVIDSSQSSKITYWQLNPSYFPPQILSRLSQINKKWQSIAYLNNQLLFQSAKEGLAPDWIFWVKNKGFVSNINGNIQIMTGTIGSYDAIRVYLWIGLMDNLDPNKHKLLQHYSSLTTLIEQYGFLSLPPEKININRKVPITNEHSPVGFSAAIIPFLEAKKEYFLKQIQEDRLKKLNFPSDNYYDDVLRLFSDGFMEKRYYFNQEGYLTPNWGEKCISIH